MRSCRFQDFLLSLRVKRSQAIVDSGTTLLSLPGDIAKNANLAFRPCAKQLVSSALHVGRNAVTMNIIDVASRVEVGIAEVIERCKVELISSFCRSSSHKIKG